MSYVELHCHSNFSLLDGAAYPEDLIRRADELEMHALALTDHDAVYGAPRFARAAQAAGVKPIFGAELTLEDDHHLTLLVQDAAGWCNLCRLISLARASAPKGQARLSRQALDGCTDGLIALSGCRRGEVASALLRGDRSGALKTARHYQKLFGQGRFWIELHNHLLPDDGRLSGELARLAEEIGAGVVATNNVHYATRDGHRLQDVLVCIKHLTTLDASEQLRRPNSEYYLKPARLIGPLFPTYPQALANTTHIAEQCEFTPSYGLQDLPEYPRPDGQSAGDFLRGLCAEALQQRYINASSEVTARLSHELEIIERSGLANYFLVVWDIVRFSRRQGIRCQGRGSAANSLVAYLLGISPIDPLAHDLVFERFLSDERRLPPDIDVDFDAARREDVIQYVYERYGEDHAAMACTFITFRARSAVRDVGRALGLSPALIDQVAKRLDSRQPAQIGETLDASRSAPWEQLLDLCRQIDGFPRHLGIHNGGMVIVGTTTTGPPLAERLPTEPASMPGRVVVQWDKDGLEDAGLVKIDLLGLRMLSVLDETVRIVEETGHARPDLDKLTFDDPAVYAMISRADTVGVFQVESRAQAQMLPRMKPRCFEDVIVAISLIRPGPIIGQMVHPYLRRRLGEEKVAYLHPKLRPALEQTLGVVLFQEQVLVICRDLAGFTPGQGEILRRALGSKHASELLDGLRQAFIDGAVSHGVEQTVAEEVFERLEGFGSYSFPKSHAAAFGVVVYQSAWLKRYHPAAFYVAILNNQPMGFWSPGVILEEARRQKITILPVDICHSHDMYTIDHGAIRTGLSAVKGLGEVSTARIMSEWSRRPFADLHDFCRRTRLARRLVENLILAGAMDSWGVDRRELLWQLIRLHYEAEDLDLVLPDDGFKPVALSNWEAMGYEEQVTGLSSREHPIVPYRTWLSSNGILDSLALAEVPAGESVVVAGMKIMHQAPPTAKGHHFVTISDEGGMINLVVRPDVYQKYRSVWRGERLLIVEGEVQRKDGVVNVIARRAVA